MPRRHFMLRDGVIADMRPRRAEAVSCLETVSHLMPRRRHAETVSCRDGVNAIAKMAVMRRRRHAEPQAEDGVACCCVLVFPRRRHAETVSC